ncbi:MAG: TGS domain-containing protein [Candidatus Bathyarchaeota archaeon]|nr:TGS domain-containing protein [Candidatus Bathyarchaeota archaeon]
MVTNLPAQAKKKWFEVTLTRNPEERSRLMQEFLSLVPKHKGTDKMCAHVKRQISQLREEIERKKRTAKTGRAPSYFPEKAGAAQVVVLGPTNVGRSSLLRAVTNAKPQVAPYPFSTRSPVPGMLQYQDIQFQLVEAPPVVDGSSEGRAGGFQILSLARNADGIIVMVDLTEDPVDQYTMVAGELEKSRILTVEPEGEVEIQKRGHGRDIQFVWEGDLEGCTVDEVVGLLREYRIRSALIRIRGRVTLDAVEDAVFGNAVQRPTLVVANKADMGGSPTAPESLRQVAEPLEVVPISALETPKLAETLGAKLFTLLGIIRIYTKEPGKEPSRNPIVARRGLTVGELAKTVHSDFYRRFKYARIWGPSAKFPAERVGLDRELADGDVIEIHV